MALYLSALSAIVPSLLLLWYFHSRDVYPEPPRVIWTTFGLGLLTILPILALTLPLTQLLEARLIHHPYLLGFAKAFLTAALPEESLKLCVLLGYCARHQEFDEPMDGLVYGAAASLGFATLENVLYVASGGLPLAITRALTAVPGHAFLGAIMGFYVGQAHFVPEHRRVLLLCAFTVPTLLHGVYDFPLLVLQHPEARLLPESGLILTSLAVLLVTAGYAQRLMELLREEQLEEQLVLAPMPEVEPEAPAEGTAVGWVLTLVGGAATTLGGLLTLGLGLTLLFEDNAGDLLFFLIGAIVIGCLPLVIGVILFRWGLDELNRPPGEDS